MSQSDLAPEPKRVLVDQVRLANKRLLTKDDIEKGWDHVEVLIRTLVGDARSFARHNEMVLGATDKVEFEIQLRIDNVPAYKMPEDFVRPPESRAMALLRWEDLMAGQTQPHILIDIPTERVSLP